jgi:lysophospholipase L1-like esterase
MGRCRRPALPRLFRRSPILRHSIAFIALAVATLSAVLAIQCVASAGPTAPGTPAARGFRGGGAAADKAAPRADANSRLAHEQLLAKAKQGKIDIYFEGDSITRRWGATDYPKYLANWKENFFGWNAADFGWGADRIENILWRLENGELDGVNPKIIVLLAGTNNISGPAGDEARVADITRGLKTVVDLCQKKAPDAVIVVMGIFPRNDNANANATIDKVNENLAKMADGKKIRYVNIKDKLADKDGKLLEGMMNTDRLHPDTKGYQVWADALKPIFTEILGPPAKEDHAPSPTGDPSAAGRAGAGSAPAGR